MEPPELPPEPPQPETLSSSPQPFATPKDIIVFLSSRGSRSHRPHLNRSPEEPARAHGSCVIHAPPPSSASASPCSAAGLPLDRRRCAPPSPLVNRSTRPSQLSESTRLIR
ncbi:hypothetical protein F2Q70_00029881 [Brassica cretica]|uniref:Uncharacterized protein n=1 Tax=Brassica cretica TaxID=69181 RepID=A0A8S9FHD7_BRACR|nr:hypothetical protein F2Q70_00029881 [Brassica cretica]KAF2557497.1 hypothetical protein F2Q68_00016619 [Brassica cretica]